MVSSISFLTKSSGSGKQQFLDHIIKDEIVFDTCIIDEAAQSTEVVNCVPLLIHHAYLLIMNVDYLAY